MERPVGSVGRTDCDARRIVGILPAALVLAVTCLFAARANGQFVAVASETNSDDSHQPSPFALLKANTKTNESLDDFKRYSGKKSWELAFHALASIDDASGNGLVPSGNGFMVPVRTRVQQLLLELSPDGRDAYRLFNDSVAKQLWEHASDTRSGIPADEMDSLHKLVDRYFLTSVGDLAADRLGDALFEKGDFASAEAQWRLIVENYPDSHLSLAKLECKRCVAFSLLGRRGDLQSLAAQIRDKYSDQNVTLGGRDVNAAEFAESLAAKTSTLTAAPPSRRSASDPDEFNLPSSDEPLWQISVAPPDMSGQMDPNTGWQMSRATFAKPTYVDVDQKRIYGNILGVVYAADIQTGKMLWRTGKFNNLPQEAMRIMQCGSVPEACFVVAAGDKVYAGCIGSKNALGQLKKIQDDNMWHMECLDAATGKTVWSFRRAGMTLTSLPYLSGGLIYAVGIGNDNTMQLLCIEPTDGVTQWLVTFGTPQMSRNWRGNFSFGGPVLFQVGNELYVATNSGALFAVNMVSHQIDWVFQHATKPADDNSRWWGMPPPDVTFSSAILHRDGLLYLKDGDSAGLCALDLSVPAVKWKRLVTTEDIIAAIDGHTAYMLGHDLSALDLTSQKLLWSTRLPGEIAPTMIAVCPNHVFAPTSRGIFDIDPANGDVRLRFHGADRQSGASRLIIAGDKLISVSETAVTAYKIDHVAPDKIHLRTTKN